MHPRETKPPKRGDRTATPPRSISRITPPLLRHRPTLRAPIRRRPQVIPTHNAHPRATTAPPEHPPPNPPRRQQTTRPPHKPQRNDHRPMSVIDRSPSLQRRRRASLVLPPKPPKPMLQLRRLADQIDHSTVHASRASSHR